jgi:isocitrate lyase
MFDLAREYAQEGMAAYARLQDLEFDRQSHFGYGAVKHQRFVGTAYFDDVAQTIAHGMSSTVALKGSTEEEQFEEAAA